MKGLVLFLAVVFLLMSAVQLLGDDTKASPLVAIKANEKVAPAQSTSFARQLLNLMSFDHFTAKPKPIVTPTFQFVPEKPKGFRAFVRKLIPGK